MTERIEHPDACDVTFARDGAQRFRSALGAGALYDIDRAVAPFPPDQAGVRLYGNTVLRSFLHASGAAGAIAGSVLGSACRPVRAILFDKTPTMNWSLAWHQDRAIVVAERVDVEGFGPWTVKSGLIHVAPPVEVLASMVTLRVTTSSLPGLTRQSMLTFGMRSYWVYILASRPRGTLYVGMSNDLVRRIYEHREGLVEGFSREYGVKMLVYYEQHATALAGQREKNIKHWSRAWKIDLIRSLNPDWRDLWHDIVR
jgi:predicted GIY-YIG superfamily endonuclease